MEDIQYAVHEMEQLYERIRRQWRSKTLSLHYGRAQAQSLDHKDYGTMKIQCLDSSKFLQLFIRKHMLEAESPSPTTPAPRSQTPLHRP